jgi:DNA-directed RNA polymerase specialized sigma24 family protein
LAAAADLWDKRPTFPGKIMKPDPKVTSSSAHEAERDADASAAARQPGESVFQFPPWDEIQMRVYNLLKKAAWPMCRDYPQLESEDLAHETFAESARTYYESPKRRARFLERDPDKRSFTGWLCHTLSSALRDRRGYLLGTRRPATFIRIEEENEEGELQDIAAIGKVLVSSYRSKFINDRIAEIIAQVFEDHAKASRDGQLSLDCVAMHDVEEYSFQEIAQYLARSGQNRPWHKVRYLVDKDKEDLQKEFEAMGVTSLKDLWMQKPSTKN